MEAELGIPCWNTGKTMYRLLTQSRVLAACNGNGTCHLRLIDAVDRTCKEIETEFTFRNPSSKLD